MADLNILGKDLAPTVRVYWQDSYRTNLPSKILRVAPDEKKHCYIVMDQTLFHPKGGGQPSDKGTIGSLGARVQVKKVMQSGRDVVVHWGKIIEGAPETDMMVTGSIDWDWRLLLMRRHSSAHLLDYCLGQAVGHGVEALDSWLGEDGYVAYRGEPPSLRELKDAERMENQLITEDRTVSSEVLTLAEATRHLGERSTVLEELQGLATVRLVTVEGCGPIGCGGTHLRSMGEAKGIRIGRVDQQPEGFRVHFDVL